MTAEKPIGSTYCAKHQANVAAGDTCIQCELPHVDDEERGIFHRSKRDDVVPSEVRGVIRRLNHRLGAINEMDARLVEMGKQLVETATWGKSMKEERDAFVTAAERAVEQLQWCNPVPTTTVAMLQACIKQAKANSK